MVLADAGGTDFPRTPSTLTVTRGATGIHFQVPNDPATYLPGLKAASARIALAGGRVATSAPRPLQLLPKVTQITPGSGPFNGTVTVEIQGTLLGLTAAAPRDPLRPSVFFGNYAIPAGDLDLSELPDKIRATLKAPADPTDPHAPRVGQKLPVRVRLNGVESRTWRESPSGGLEIAPNLLFEVT